MPILDPGAYDLVLLVIGLLGLGGIVVPLLLRRRLVTYPIVVIVSGAAFAVLPQPLPEVDPLTQGPFAEHLAELAVILALTTIGLKLDRPIGLRAWRTTWLLLAITMPLTIAVTAWLGWGLLGLTIPAAVLLGAVLAPTDPVLADDVQTGPPTVEGEGEGEGDQGSGPGEGDEVRFALTSESALNDGLAFPFTNLALLLVLVGTAPREWLPSFLLVEVTYRIGVAVALGWGVGKVIGWLVLRLARRGDPARGVLTLALTLISYAVAELAGGYGFIAVFVTAVVVRSTDRDHDAFAHLHEGAEQLERLTAGLVLFLVGAAVTGGVLAPTTPGVIAVAALLVVVVRPVTGWLGLLSAAGPTRDERLVVSVFGIRGIGSVYYLAHALGEGPFADADLLWATVTWTILLSVLVHGLGAQPAMSWLDRRRDAAGPAASG